nr:hypothetical protein [Nocardia amikacinitolerans]
MDGLLEVDASLGMSRLRWLSTGPPQPDDRSWRPAVRRDLCPVRRMYGIGTDLDANLIQLILRFALADDYEISVA